MLTPEEIKGTFLDFESEGGDFKGVLSVDYDALIEILLSKLNSNKTTGIDNPSGAATNIVVNPSEKCTECGKPYGNPHDHVYYGMENYCACQGTGLSGRREAIARELNRWEREGGLEIQSFDDLPKDEAEYYDYLGEAGQILALFPSEARLKEILKEQRVHVEVGGGEYYVIYVSDDSELDDLTKAIYEGE